MNKYSMRSRARLETCHPIIQEILTNVLQEVDHTILCGSRGRDDQDEAVRAGHSKTSWPNSKHNVTLPDGVTEDPDGQSMAVDAAIYHTDLPHIRWDGTTETFGEHCLFAGYVLSEAARVLKKRELHNKFYLRWGGDWNSNKSLRDNSFDDMVHFELVERN